MVIRCGVDIVEIARIQKALLRYQATFLDRVFTVMEQEICRGKGKGATASYAARFAAKEAVAKALGTGIGSGAAFTDIEIRQGPSGAPFAILYRDAKKTYEGMGGIDLSISLSHERQYAIAQAVILIE